MLLVHTCLVAFYDLMTPLVRPGFCEVCFPVHLYFFPCNRLCESLSRFQNFLNQDSVFY